MRGGVGNNTKIGGRAALSIGVCMLVCASEGFDLAAAALVGPTLTKTFNLSGSQFGLTITCMMAGFFFGAWGGGALGDRYGRKLIMLLSMALLALFYLITLRAETLPFLLAVRFITGLGIGGVLPNALALAADSVEPAVRSRAVTLTNGGASIGAVSAGVLLAVGGDAVTWRTYFEIGAAAPLLIGPLAWAVLPSGVRGDSTQRAKNAASAALFGASQRRITLLIWLAVFLAAVVHGALSVWMPLLLPERGLPANQVGAAIAIFGVSGLVGAFCFAALFDRGRSRLAVALAFGGSASALFALAGAYSPALIAATMVLAGLTVYGGYVFLHAILAACYPPAHRGIGVGAGVAVARIGAVIAPVTMGVLLDNATGALGVVVVLLPAVLLAGASALAVARSALPSGQVQVITD